MQVKKFRTRQEAVCDYVRQSTVDGLSLENGGFSGIDALTVSTALHLDRANVSKELNKLYREGQVIKFLGKPTLFMHRAIVLQRYPGTFIPATIPKNTTLEEYLQRPVSARSPISEQPGSEFDEQIGVAGSLKGAVELAKAAVSYPAKGLHMLISGSAGCGKTHFAQKIHSFAVSTGIYQDKAPFIIFDCQDAHASPQVLQSKLFGCAKEFSKTGTRGHQGLLERASGGILCLDGVEHLPTVIQNQLATFFEKNTFKRFGENEFNRIGNVMLLCLTSEPSNPALAERFSLSIPIHIHIPDLNDRGIDELFSYISLLFRREASLIGRTIHVDKGALAALLCKTYRGNVAQLQGVIRTICALAATSYSNAIEGDEILWIDSGHLPASILKESASSLPVSLEVEAILKSFPMGYAVFSAHSVSTARTIAPAEKTATKTATSEQTTPLVIATYGYGAAEEQASLINSICERTAAIGISFLPDTPLDTVLITLFDMLRRVNHGEGVFLATDIVPLYRMQDYFRKQIGSPLSILSDLRLPSLLLVCGTALGEDTPAEYFSERSVLSNDYPHQNAPAFLNRIISEVLAPTLTFLNPQKAAMVLLDTLENILSDLSRPYSDEIAIRFVFHCSHMLERLIRGNAYKYDRLRSFMNENSQIYTCIERRLLYVAESFGVSIPAAEIAYVTELFTY